MHISVIVPSYRSQAQLPNTLKAIARQHTELDIEVVVVDCTETDDIRKICDEYPQVRFAHESERFNPGKGRNIGAKLAQGELLVFVDSDVVLQADALGEAYAFFQQGKPIFGGALELNEETSKTVASYLEHFFFNHESQRGRQVQQRSNLSSALMLFSREIFLKEGGFRDIPRMQDTELTERLRARGYELFFTPRVVGLQTQDSPLSKVLRKIYINGKNLYFIRYQQKSLPFKIALGVGLPALGGVKVARIAARHLRYQTPKNRVVTLALLPLLAVSGAYWVAGLYRSMVLGGGIGKSRD